MDQDDEKKPIKVIVKKSTQWAQPPAKFELYPMERKPRGQVLIINNEEFEDMERFHTRTGSSVDAANFSSLFDQLGFTTWVVDNLDKEGFERVVKDFSKWPEHSVADACVVVVLSHGDDGVIFTQDSGEITTEWLFEQFNHLNCQALQGKPKLFFLQACRGEKQDLGCDAPSVPEDSIRISPTSQDYHFCPPWKNPSTNYSTWGDMIVSYSTITGYRANRNMNWGSWYAESICSVFADNSHDMEFSDMLHKVTDYIKKYESDKDGIRQTCTFHNRGFSNKLYFNPGLSK